jgi:hypothetical protein
MRPVFRARSCLRSRRGEHPPPETPASRHIAGPPGVSQDRIILGRELHLDDGIVAMSHGRRLGPTDLAGRTARVWLIPSTVEGLDVTAAPYRGPGYRLAAQRPESRCPRDGHRAVSPAAAVRCESCESPRHQHRAAHGLDVSDRVRLIILARFRDMYFVAYPRHGVLRGRRVS